jgi:hypothetical protein
MELTNFVEVVLDDDDEDEGTEASELFFFRYWYDIRTSSLLLYSLTLSLFLSYSLSLSLTLSLLPARDTRISLGKNNFEKLQNISNFLLARCCLSLSPLERRRMATPTRIRTASMVVPPSSLLKSSKKRKSLSESLRSKRRHQRVKVVSFNENGFVFVESALDATLTSAIALSVLYSYYYISSSSNVDDDDDDGDDLRTRWTVASFLSLLPIFGSMSWFLPQLSFGSWEAEAKSEGELKRQKRFSVYALVYFISYARFGGFDLTRKETWFVAATCFAHTQIESPFGLLKPERKVLMKGFDGDEEEDINENRIVIKEIAASLKASLFGTSNSSKGIVKAEEKGRKIEESGGAAAVKSSFAKHLGEYIGELQVQLQNLPTDVQEGRIRAQIEREIEATEQMLEKEKSIASDEIEKWDRKWMLRRMRKPELIETCKQNGIKGYSRLNKMEIVEMIERFEDDDVVQ